jgi:tetratricopeptide (TPR) repeat protein
VGRPGVPDPHPAQAAGPDAESQPLITWQDLGDALYLASVRYRTEAHAAGPENSDQGAPPDDPAPDVPRSMASTPESQREPPDQPGTADPAAFAEIEKGFLTPEDDEPESWQGPELRVVPGEGTEAAQVALPGMLEYFRALRPLKRKVLSRHTDDVSLDESATASQAAETDLWWPVTRTNKRRWLDLTLVVDANTLWALWHSQIAAFVTMLERLGAFRSVQVRLLDTDHDATPVLRGMRNSVARDPAEVLDPSGRRIVLVLTDGVDEAWRKGLYGPVLAKWGRVMPVTLIHLLPQWVWRRGGLGVHQAQLSVSGELLPNARWEYRVLDDVISENTSGGRGKAVPIPVVEMNPRWLHWWAGLITGEFRQSTPASILLSTEESRPLAHDGSGPPGIAPSPADIVKHFRTIGSPRALRIATLLAALPADIAVVDLLRDQFVPEASSADVAELFVGGLMRPDQHERGTLRYAGTWTFPAGVRELLLGNGRRSETSRLVQVAAKRLNGRFRVLGHLRDAIADPHGTPDPELTLGTVSDVELECAVMRALSGPYLSRADRIVQVLKRDSNSTKKIIADTPFTSASDTMLDPATGSIVKATPAHSAPAASEQYHDTQPAESSVNLTTQSLVPVGDRIHKRLPDDPPPVWGNVPPRNPNFTGRREPLEQLGIRLTAGGTAAVLPSTLHGMGGIGKTQIATEYIYRHLQDYDVIWWIDAARETQIRASLTDLARQLGLPGSHEAHTAVPAVREALRTGRPYRRWLLVFDAAETPESVRPFFPTNGPGEILITSRNADWAGVARPLELAVFKREESLELLGRRGPEIDTVEADTLAEKLGDLPLAIEQAAAWRAVTGMPVSEYMRLFDESVAEILDTSAPPDYELSVAAAWSVSFDELKVRNSAAHQILHICAFFSPEPISRDLFTGVSRVSISPELDDALRNPMTLARAIRDINRYGLAKIDHGNNTIQLHRLVQMVLRSRVMAPAVHAQMQHGAHQLLASLDPNDPESARNWTRYRELLPHAYAADIINCDDGWVRQLAINLMRFLSASGDHEEAMQLATRAYDRFAEKLGPVDPQTLDVATRLGFYLWALGRFSEAANINQRTLALRLEVSGEDDEETFNLQTNIVIDSRSRGDFAGGAKLSEDIHRRTRNLFGEDDPESLNAAYQHAISLRLSGHYQAAADLDEDTYRRRVEVLGPDHPRTLSTNAALIVDRREAGHYMRARIEQERLTELYRQRLGVDSPDTVTVTFMLAVARRKDGNHEGALPLSAEAYSTFQLIYGRSHPTTMACALAYSIDLRHSGDLPAAKKMGEETFDLYRRAYGEQHPHTLGATVDLGVTLRLQGDVAGSRELDERALESLRAGVGPDHPYAIIASINLASDVSAMGDLDGAVELGKDAVERGRRVLGEEHPTVLAARFNLSLDLRAHGGQEESEPHHSAALAGYSKVLGDSHPGAIAATKGARADCDIDPILL